MMTGLTSRNFLYFSEDRTPHHAFAVLILFFFLIAPRVLTETEVFGRFCVVRFGFRLFTQTGQFVGCAALPSRNFSRHDQFQGFRLKRVLFSGPVWFQWKYGQRNFQSFQNFFIFCKRIICNFAFQWRIVISFL